MTIKVKLPLSDNTPPVEGAVDDTTQTASVPGDTTVDDTSTDASDDTSTTTTDDVEVEQIEIDGNTYNLDSNGNAIDETGKVIMTADDIANNGNDDTSISVDDIEQMSGIQLKDSDGNKIVFDLTVEGLAKREKLIQDSSIEQGRNSAITEFFQANPDLYKVFLHKQKTGTIENYQAEPVYSGMTLDVNNEDQLKSMIIAARIKKGDDADTANSYAEFCKVQNILQKQGESSYNYLKSLEDKDQNDYQQQTAVAKQKAIESDSKYYGTYYDDNGKEIIVNTPGSIYNKIVTQGKFGNYVIPENGISIKQGDKVVTVSRRQIFDYVATPVKDGRTQAQIDAATKYQDIDFMLQQYLLNLTGNDLSVFIERRVLEKKAQTIKKKIITSSNSGNANSGGGNKKIILPVN